MVAAQHSVLRPASLLTLVKRHYPTIGASDCRILALNCNDNYFIRGRRRDYVFRLNRRDWWPAAEFDEELRFLEFLKRHRIRAVTPKRNRHGQRYISVSTAEGIRHAALFGYLAGKHLTFSPGPRNSNMVRLGELAARLHDAADRFTPPAQRWTLSFDSLVTETLAGLAPLFVQRERDFVYLQRLADRLQALLEDTPAGALDFGLCHGDLHTGNVWLSPDGDLTLIDFDWVGYCWRIHDLATLWWTLRSDRDAPLGVQCCGVIPAYVHCRDGKRHCSLRLS